MGGWVGGFTWVGKVGEDEGDHLSYHAAEGGFLGQIEVVFTGVGGWVGGLWGVGWVEEEKTV